MLWHDEGLSREEVGLCFDNSDRLALQPLAPSTENPGCANSPLISGLFSGLCDVFCARSYKNLETKRVICKHRKKDKKAVKRIHHAQTSSIRRLRVRRPASLGISWPSLPSKRSRWASRWGVWKGRSCASWSWPRRRWSSLFRLWLF